MIDLKKHKTENDHQYIWRIAQAKDSGLLDMTWDELGEVFNSELRPDNVQWDQSAYRKPYQQAKAYYDNVFAYMIDGTYEENIRALTDELYKAKQKYYDQRREYNVLLREEARFEHLEDVMKDAISNLNTIKFVPDKYVGDKNVEAVLLISDIHYGLLVDSVLNYYDCNVAEERLKIVCEKAKYYCQKNNVSKLHIIMLGDLISGMIKVQHQIAAEEDVITQIENISEILSMAILYLNRYIPEIKLYGVYGNHSRVQPDKKKQVKVENFERLIFKHIELRTGIKILQNGLEDWQVCEIKNRKIFFAHGDEDTISNAREHAINVSRIIPDVIYLGHTHHLQVNDVNGTEIIVGGSLISTDDYAMKLRAVTDPYQVMHVFDGDDDYIIKITAREEGECL